MKYIISLDNHRKSITGGHKYNDAFSKYLERISGIKIQGTPSCAAKYHGWRKIYSPFTELKWLYMFTKDTLVMFGDTTYKHHILLALLTKWFTRANTTIIIHHFPFYGQKGLSWKFNKWLMCKYINQIDSIIVPSPFTMNVAKSLFPNKTIYYVPLPFERVIKESHCTEVGNLLYVGTIEKRKGLSYLVDAISYLDNKEAVQLNIVGKVTDQHYYKKLQQKIQDLGLSNNIHFLGKVSNEELAVCYQKAEIFTFPSLLEGYGIVLIEALKNGLPIICFDNSAMPYTVKDGKNGFLAKNKDAKDMAAKIQLLVGNKPLRQKLQKGIKETVIKLKTETDFEEGIANFYKSVSNE